MSQHIWTTIQVIEEAPEQKVTGLLWPDGRQIVSTEIKQPIGFYGLHELDDGEEWGSKGVAP